MAAFTSRCINSSNVYRFRLEPLAGFEGKLFNSVYKTSLMVEASDHISKFIFIVTAYSKVLTTQIHIIDKSQLAFVINDVRLLTRNWHVSFLSTNQQEFIIWHVKCFKVSRKVMLSQLIIVNEFQLLKISYSLYVVIYLKCVSIESN